MGTNNICVPASINCLSTLLIKIYNMSPSPKSKDSQKNGKDSSPKHGKNSPSKKEVDADAHTAAMDLFAQGKRHLLVNDIKASVESLQEACRMLAEQHGETSPEVGDAYFYYGRALLEMARMESDVLGLAMEGVPEGEDLDNSQVENPDKLSEEEKEKVSEQVDDALQENSTNSDAKKSSPSKDKAKSNLDEAMDTDKSGESQDDSSQDESQEESGEDGEDLEKAEGEKKEDEDVPNHQLAWEMLELAKVIFQKQESGNVAMSLKTAQVFLKLGEVGLESETYPQSIEDFMSCLKIQEKHLEADNRCLAETHYQLGVAYSFSDDFDKSLGSFSKSLKIIEDRVTNLKKGTSPSKGSKQSPSKDAKDVEAVFEMKELNNLIPEIKEKIQDMEEMKKDAKDKINKVKKELGMATAIGGDVEAKTIQTKKGKTDGKADSPPKKTKAENGDATTDLKIKAAADMENKTKELKKQSV